MDIVRDTTTFNSFIHNYWEYYRELEKEFLQTQKYVEFCADNNATYSVEYLKLFQAVCSEIEVVGKVIAKTVNESFKVDDKSNSIEKWWYEIQNVLLLTDGYFTYMNPTAQPKCFTLLEYKCLLMDRIVLQPWKNYRIENYLDSADRLKYRLVKGCNTPKWWSSYNKVKHNRMVSMESKKKNTNYSKANFKNVSNAFAALYILEKAFIDMIGTYDDLSCFMNFSDLFVKRKRYSFAQMDEISQSFKP